MQHEGNQKLRSIFVNTIIHGDALTVLKTIPDEFVDCVVTSLPYWALRDYGVAGQIGLEPTFHEYLTKLCTVFDEESPLMMYTMRGRSE